MPDFNLWRVGGANAPWIALPGSTPPPIELWGGGGLGVDIATLLMGSVTGPGSDRLTAGVLEVRCGGTAAALGGGGRWCDAPHRGVGVDERSQVVLA